MLISSAKDLGDLIRKERREQGLTQSQLAAASGAGTRFIVDIESGKPTAQIEKAFFVLSMLGLDIYAEKREKRKSSWFYSIKNTGDDDNE